MSIFLKKPFTEFENLKSLQFIILISISIFVTVFTILIQSSAIRYVEAEKAVIIYTIEPIATMVLGFVFLGGKTRRIRGGGRLYSNNFINYCILI